MPIPKSDKIWFNGDLVGWDEAQVHVLSHVVHYGSSVFEGLRCYETPKGSACFRLMDHVNRLFDSAKIYRMDIPYSREAIHDAIVETIRVNKLNSCYVRPIVFRGYGELGVNPVPCPVEVVSVRTLLFSRWAMAGVFQRLHAEESTAPERSSTERCRSRRPSGRRNVGSRRRHHRGIERGGARTGLGVRRRDREPHLGGHRSGREPACLANLPPGGRSGCLHHHPRRRPQQRSPRGPLVGNR